MTTQAIKQETQDLISKCLGYKDALFYTTLNEPYGSWVHFNSLAMQADITDWLRIEKIFTFIVTQFIILKNLNIGNLVLKIIQIYT